MAKACRLSVGKYRSASAMIAKTAEITHAIEVIEAGVAEARQHPG